MVGLLCAASYDVSGIPAVNMRIVFALFIACAPFALQPLAHARAILACEGLHVSIASAPCMIWVTLAAISTGSMHFLCLEELAKDSCT